ncbi:SIR2 family NAD-dependent protein deacylase [Sandaracinus amylolyticus]|uniref:SIR2 family NAD-dependent protein deacylase n=1 Tax=Sandaracinus amylolyticus TaxID=927083 RepID=UPI001F1FAEF1|nr:NAD-dependent deacylase [Sandaracinus amylolyticus]UJR80332.1 NAD-dependent protein deacetylase [Sandaracinus amylolyticus]
MSTNDRIRDLVSWLRESKRTVALTGAGVSTDSGIPDFRSPRSGLWAKHDPMQVASISGFHSDPATFYGFWAERFGALGQAEPNVAHRVLAKLEARGLVHAIVTQNIDGLHQRAGSRRVLEVHGTWRTARCTTCGARFDTLRLFDDVPRGATGRDLVPTCDRCGGLVKPDVVLFGEALSDDFAEAERTVDRCDLLVVLGTSLEVWPVAGLAPRAHAAGGRVVVINRESTAADQEADLVIHAELREAMQRIARDLDITR